MNQSATYLPTPRATPSLGWFVSLSLVVHLGVLWVVLPDAPNWPAVNGQQRVSTLTVRLQSHPAASSTQEAKPVRPVPVATKPVTRNKPKPRSAANTPRQVLQPLPDVAHSPPSDTVPADTSTTSQSETRSSLLEDGDDSTTLQKHLTISIQRALADHFSYPLLARRRGWEGEVLLAFRIEADGRIIDAHIARSSGYGLLDNAALNALSQVKRLEHGIPHSISMQLPVIYRLEG